MAFLVPIGFKAKLTMSQPVDAAGNPATFDGTPIWSVSDPSKFTIAIAPDGLSATYIPAGPLGTAQAQVSVDADMGSGVKPIVGVLDLEVVAGEAVSVGITGVLEPVTDPIIPGM